MLSGKWQPFCLGLNMLIAKSSSVRVFHNYLRYYGKHRYFQFCQSSCLVMLGEVLKFYFNVESKENICLNSYPWESFAGV